MVAAGAVVFAAVVAAGVVGVGEAVLEQAARSSTNIATKIREGPMMETCRWWNLLGNFIAFFFIFLLKYYLDTI